MIKYYDTLAAYEADVKSDYESQVSLIGADNTVKFDGRNVVVGLASARTGSIVVLDGNKAMQFVSVDTFSSASFMSNYEVVGVVWVGIDHPSYRGDVVILNKEWATSLKIVEIYQWRLTGYTLDGTDRAGTLSVRYADDNWAANHDYVVSYNASDAASLVEQLNAYFRANEPFITQQWKAVLTEGGEIDLQLQNWTSYNSAGYNKGINGFALTANLLPEWPASANMLRKNGYRNSEGVIINWARALYYFRNDNASASYNPSSDVTSVKQRYPICLPGYLGTSKYQSDHCSFLRSVYGEGEGGWLKFMESFLPVRPIQYGINGDPLYGDPKTNTYKLAHETYTDIDGNVKPISPACAYIAGIGYDNVLTKKGEWLMPDADLLFDMLDGIEYPLNPDRESDVRNRALLAIGAKPFGNNSYIRSCSRSNAYSGWFANGNYGYAISSSLYGAYVAAPLLLLRVAEHAAKV